MKSPRVSVIVPVYNEGTAIGRCIEALLLQDLPQVDREVIIVDNGSTDSTADVVSGYPVNLITEDELVGSYAARNHGIAAAQGAVLAFTDADCIPSRGWLRIALKAFDDPEVYLAGGEIQAAPPSTEVERYQAAGDFLSHKFGIEHPFRPYLQTANVFYRRELFERIGTFNADLISGGDADMSWRAQAAGFGPIRFVPEACVVHRHRADRHQMLRQSFKWGVGAGCIARLHGGEMGPVRHQIERHARLHVVGASWRWFAALPQVILGGEKARHRLRWAGWELLGATRWWKGYRVGYADPGTVKDLRL